MQLYASFTELLVTKMIAIRIPFVADRPVSIRISIFHVALSYGMIFRRLHILCALGTQ